MSSQSFEEYSQQGYQTGPVQLEISNFTPQIEVTDFSYKISKTSLQFNEIKSTDDTTALSDELKVFINQSEPLTQQIPVFLDHLQPFVQDFEKFQTFINLKQSNKSFLLKLPKDNNRYKILGFCNEFQEQYTPFQFKHHDKFTLILSFSKTFNKTIFKQKYIHFTINEIQAIRQLLREIPAYQPTIAFKQLKIFKQKGNFARVIAPSNLLVSSLQYAAKKLQIQVGDFQLSDEDSLQKVQQIKIRVKGDLRGLELELNTIKQYQMPLRVPYYNHEKAATLIAQKKYYYAALEILTYETGFYNKDVKTMLQQIIQQASSLNNQTKPSRLANAILQLNLKDQSYKLDRQVRDYIFSIYQEESSKFFTAFSGPALARCSELALNIGNIRRNDIVQIDDKIQVSQVELNAQIIDLVVPEIGAQYEDLVLSYNDVANRYIHSNKGAFIRGDVYPKDIHGSCLVKKAQWRKVMHNFTNNLFWKHKEDTLIIKIYYDNNIEISPEEFIYSISGYNVYDIKNDNFVKKQNKITEHQYFE